MAKGVYPMLYRNDEKFPGGESINELAQRANTAITAFVLPHVWQAAKEGKTGVHIAVVSHGLCISQMISELLKMGTKQDEGDYRGLQNTAWTRLVIDIEVRTLGQIGSLPANVPQGAQEGQPVERSLLTMRVTDVNRHSHIDNIVSSLVTVFAQHR